MSGLVFPVKTAALSEYLPHRLPALWVDEVSSVRENEGTCRIQLRADAHYADAQGRVRDSSFVEWIAQSYGFVAACQVLCGMVADEKRPTKTFLVQVRDLEVNGTWAERPITPGDWVTVQVRRTHRLGPLALIEGEVRSSEDAVLARAKLKLYAE